jgi:hypothetical protein
MLQFHELFSRLDLQEEMYWLDPQEIKRTLAILRPDLASWEAVRGPHTIALWRI